MRSGLEALLRANSSAYDAEADIWDFSLCIDLLYERGLSITNLRWLVAKGFVEHGNDISSYGQSHRTFKSGAGFRFDKDTCFVLTPLGVRITTDMIANSVKHIVSVNPFITNQENEAPASIIDKGINQQSSIQPCWNADRRELYFGDVLIKKFRVPAHNQEWILQSFEDEGWPESIQDTLPSDYNTCPKTRLRDTISRLNRKQLNPRLRFRGNGTGRAICWEVLL